MSAVSFELWLKSAKPGEDYVYHDTGVSGFDMDGRVFSAAWSAKDAGRVVLFQSKGKTRLGRKTTLYHARRVSAGAIRALTEWGRRARWADLVAA